MPLPTAHVSEPRHLADLAWWAAREFAGQQSIGRSTAAGVAREAASEWMNRIQALAKGLATLGVQGGDRVAIISESRPEWLYCDLAVLSLGAVTVPIYPTLMPAQTAFILADCGARFAIASTTEQVAKVQQARHQLPALETVLLVEGDVSADWPVGSVLALAEIEARGRALVAGHAAEDWRRLDSIDPAGLATIIYTSGTTGQPKGVMLTHRNLLSNAKGAGEVIRVGPSDTALSFLPLSHSFERMAAYAYLLLGVSVVFAESLETVARDLQAVKPTMMTAVPRVFEKLHARIVAQVEASGGARQTIFNWALRVGTTGARARRDGRWVAPWTSVQAWVADHLVADKVRQQLGGRLRLAFSGSAPLAATLCEFFDALGLPVIEGYGLTETSPALTVNPPEAPRFGTVGKALRDVELRVAPDGEILARGPNIMLGYYNQPDETAKVIVDGWFHTGDIGALDADGYLTLTDRKKDLIVTSGGKNIAPQPIENVVRRSPLVAEAVMIGDRRRFSVMLIVPNQVVLRTRLKALGRPADDALEALVTRPDLVALYQEIVDGLNRDLASFERVKKIAVLPTEFSIASGELTPSLKVKRAVVEERWHELLEGLYSNG